MDKAYATIDAVIQTVISAPEDPAKTGSAASLIDWRGIRAAIAPVVAKAAEKRGEFLLEHRFDGRADVGPQPLLNRVEPGLPGQ